MSAPGSVFLGIFGARCCSLKPGLGSRSSPLPSSEPLPAPPTPALCAAAILRTLTVVAHFLSAFPPLQRTDVVAFVKSRWNLRQNETGSCELRVLAKQSAELRNGNGDVICDWWLVSFLF